MKKAYCVFPGFSQEAQHMLTQAGISLTVSTSPTRPNEDELLALLMEIVDMNALIAYAEEYQSKQSKEWIKN